MSSPVHARPAQPADYGSYARLFPELGVPEPPALEPQWRAELMPCSMVLESDGAVVAYAYYTLLADTGHVRHLIVDPGQRRRGYGRALMLELAELFGRAGCRAWRLYVLVDNTAAQALYMGLGMRRAYRSQVVSLALADVARLPAATATLRAVGLEPGAERSVEQRFDMPAGMLASLRIGSEASMLALIDDARPAEGYLGVARLVAGLRAYPLHVAEPGLIRGFIDGMRPHLAAGADSLVLTCEGDAELAQLLIGAGGRVVMDTFCLTGALPPVGG